MIRAVLDANVIVAAMLNPGGLPAEVVRQVGLAYELVWSAPIVAEDPSDDVYLSTALVGAARWVVSGDQHLLALGRFAGVGVVRPAAFLAELTGR